MIKENLIRLFENSMKNNWDRPAMTDYLEKKTYTYGDIAKEVARLHVLFKSIGFEKGDKIALVGKNGPKWCTVYIATVTYGGVIVPILQDFNPNDIQHIVNHSDAKFLFISDNLWDNLFEEDLLYINGVFSLNDYRCIHQKDGYSIQKAYKAWDENFQETFPNGFSAADVLYPTIPNSEMVCISYTSGSTGFSKGVMLPHRALWSNVKFAIEELHILEPGDGFICMLPLAHMFGLVIELLHTFCVGCHIYFLTRVPSPKVIMDAFAHVKPKVIIAVPLILEKIIKTRVFPLLEKPIMSLMMKVPFVDDYLLGKIKEKIEITFRAIDRTEDGDSE